MEPGSTTNANAGRRLALVLVVLAAVSLAACGPSEPLPFPDHHDGYWVTEFEDSETGERVTFVNDLHADPESRRVTVYAQARRGGYVASPAQLGPGECGEDPSGHFGCFHPNAVYLNGSGVEHTRADGTGEWWVKHSWVLDGEGYENCVLGTRARESYTCVWVEGVAHEDGVSMQIGPTLFPISLIYNVRTPLLDRDPIVVRATRHGPMGIGGSLLLECEPEPSALDGVVRACPSLDRQEAPHSANHHPGDQEWIVHRDPIER